MKEERTEYVGVYLTPTMAKQVKEAADNNVLKDKILKQFVDNEIGWLKDEVHNMDEITTIYRAKLLTIKDHFEKAQSIYVEEIEALISKSSDAIRPLNDRFINLGKQVETVQNQVETAATMVNNLSSKIGNIDYWRIEKLLDAVDRFNKMSEDEKELIKLILQK